ncbi:MAG TPA: PDR/VanB family oxidoreductase [Acetobacteraceae bacterium]
MDPHLDLVVARREQQAHGVVVLDLAAADGAILPPFDAGAHVDVLVAPGLVRPYSLCGDPADRSRYRLGVLLEAASRGGSAAVHGGFGVGDRVRTGLPRNRFPLAPTAAASVLIGGGIGITPLLAMAHHLHRAGQDFMLHYCARDRGRAAFLAEMGQAPFKDRVRLHFDDGPLAQRLDRDHDLPPPAPGTHLYVCGPAGFMEWVIAGARQRSHAEAQIHSEAFTAAVDEAGDGFEVVLSKSGRTVAVPAGATIVQALAGVGVRVDVSCEQGVCGTCLCDVVEGVPDHRDTYLTDEEKAANDQMTLCCSRAKTPRLVLAL